MPMRHRQLNLPPVEVETVQTSTDSGLKSLRTWKDLFIGAMQRARLSQKATASTLGISEQQFSNQLAYDGERNRDHLSFWRMRELPPEFWEELIQLLCEYHAITIGRTPREREDGELGRAFRELTQKAIR